MNGRGGWSGGGCLFEAGHLLNVAALRMGTYSRWVLIRGCALIKINMVLNEAPFINCNNN